MIFSFHPAVTDRHYIITIIIRHSTDLLAYQIPAGKPQTSAKQRLAGRLGILAPPAGCSLPLIRDKKTPALFNEDLTVFGECEGIRHVR